MYVNRAALQTIRVHDVPSAYKEQLTLAGIVIRLCSQRTGYGSRRLFICPTCGARCLTLYELWDGLYCRSCLPLELYGYRRNMYDEGGTQLITWHMRRLMASVGVHRIKFPFDYMDYLLAKPRYVRWKRWETTVKKAQMLENMRFCAIFAGKHFNATDIKMYTSDSCLNQYEIWEIKDYVLFASREDCMARLPK